MDIVHKPPEPVIEGGHARTGASNGEDAKDANAEGSTDQNPVSQPGSQASSIQNASRCHSSFGCFLSFPLPYCLHEIYLLSR